MEGEAAMPRQPCQHLGVLVRGIVVENDVEQFARRHLGLDGVEEADELLVPVALHAVADDPALQHVQGGANRVVVPFPLVVVRHGAVAAFLPRQARLGAVERLDLALLIHRQHDGVHGRIDIETDAIADLGSEQRIVRQLELPHPMRLQAVAAPDALHRADADPGGRCHCRTSPVRGLARRVGQRQRDHAVCHPCPQRRDARRAGLVAQQAVHPRRHEALLPAPDTGLGLTGQPHDLARAVPVGREQHDPRPPHMLLRAVPIHDHRVQHDRGRSD